MKRQHEADGMEGEREEGRKGRRGRRESAESPERASREEEEEEEAAAVEGGAPMAKSALVLREPITFVPFYDARLGKKKGMHGGNEGTITVHYREEVKVLFEIHNFLKVYLPSLDYVGGLLESYHDRNKSHDASEPTARGKIVGYASKLKELNKLILENMNKCVDLEQGTVLYPLEVDLCRHVYVALTTAKQRTVLHLYEIFTDFKHGSEEELRSILMRNGFSPDVPYCMGTIVSTNLPYSVKRDSRIYLKIELLTQGIADIKPANVGIQTETPNLELLSLSEASSKELLLSCRFQKGTRSTPIQLRFTINAAPSLKSGLQRVSPKFSSKVSPSDWVVVHTNEVQMLATEPASVLARMGFNADDSVKESAPFPAVINKALEYMVYKIGRRFLLSSPKKAGPSSPSTTFTPDVSAETNNDASSRDGSGDSDDDDENSDTKMDTEKAARTLNSMASSSSSSSSSSLLISSSSSSSSSSSKRLETINIDECTEDNDVFNKSFLTTYDISLIHRTYFGGKQRVSKEEIEKFLKAIFFLVSLTKFSSQVAKLWEAGYIANFMEKDVASALAKKVDASVLRFCFDHNDGLAIATPSGKHYIIPFDSKRDPGEIIPESADIGKILKVRTKKLGSLSVGDPGSEDPLISLDSKYFVSEDKSSLFPSTPIDPPDTRYKGYVVLK